jgi:hypothetical protein
MAAPHNRPGAAWNDSLEAFSADAAPWHTLAYADVGGRSGPPETVLAGLHGFSTSAAQFLSARALMLALPLKNSALE